VAPEADGAEPQEAGAALQEAPASEAAWAADDADDGFSPAEQAEPSGAPDDLAEPPAAEPRRADSKLDRARDAAIAGDVAVAIELYRELLVDRPHTTELRETLGMLYESRGQPERAIEQYEIVRDAEPENVDNLIRLANVLAALNRFDAAERELRRAVRVDPMRPAAFTVLGIINFRRGLYAQAELELMRAIELDQHAALAYHYRGEALNQLSRVDEALAMLERAAQLQPDHARTYYVMGILFDKKNRPQDAAAMFRKAREVTAA
jgi:tetratricopeptide (TPR) repeat protein